MKFDITIYGAGYVGLVTGACLADLGHQVLLVDIKPERIAQLEAGECPIHEPLLPELLARQVKAGRISFTGDIRQGVDFGYLQFITVGTPSKPDGSVDLSAIHAIAADIGKYLKHDAIIINKSTSPVGTSAEIYRMIHEQQLRHHNPSSFDVISNPEFLKQGDAIKDFMQPRRVIVGVKQDSPLYAQIKHDMLALYSPLISEELLLFMDPASSELSKYAANAFLATKVSFINEMSRLSELFNADIDKIRVGIGLDERIGMEFLRAGCGYGGSCFPKDVKGLVRSSQEKSYHPLILEAVDKVNERQKTVIFKKLSNYFNNSLENKTIALWGLAFKPNTDDMREAPSRALMEKLWQYQVKVQAYDPAANQTAAQLYRDQPLLKICSHAEEALKHADVLVIVTEWPEFRSPDFAMIKKRLKYPAIFDGRNIFNPQEVINAGLRYFGIGYGEII